MITLSYNQFLLTSEPYNITSYDGYSQAKRELKTVELARTDGSVLMSDRLTDKTITVTGQIKTDTPGDLLEAIKELKRRMYPSERTLSVLDEDGVTREWEATPSAPIITRQRGGATQAFYTIEFYCPKPYSTSASNELLNDTITTQDATLGMTIPGSYPAAPVVTLTINSITAGEQSITIKNPASVRGITITGGFEAGDTLVIDMANLTVYLNTDKIDYEGVFTKWLPGAGSINYVDTASSRDVDIVVTADERDL